VVAHLGDALDSLVARGMEEPEPLEAISVAVVVDLLGVYMVEMGAVGGAAGSEGGG